VALLAVCEAMPCAEQATQTPFGLLLLVLFLQKQEKYNRLLNDNLST